MSSLSVRTSGLHTPVRRALRSPHSFSTRTLSVYEASEPQSPQAVFYTDAATRDDDRSLQDRTPSNELDEESSYHEEQEVASSCEFQQVPPVPASWNGRPLRSPTGVVVDVVDLGMDGPAPGGHHLVRRRLYGKQSDPDQDWHCTRCDRPSAVCGGACMDHRMAAAKRCRLRGKQQAPPSQSPSMSSADFHAELVAALAALSLDDSLTLEELEALRAGPGDAGDALSLDDSITLDEFEALLDLVRGHNGLADVVADAAGAAGLAGGDHDLNELDDDSSYHEEQEVAAMVPVAAHHPECALHLAEAARHVPPRGGRVGPAAAAHLPCMRMPAGPDGHQWQRRKFGIMGKYKVTHRHSSRYWHEIRGCPSGVISRVMVRQFAPTNLGRRNGLRPFVHDSEYRTTIRPNVADEPMTQREMAHWNDLFTRGECRNFSAGDTSRRA